MSRTTYYWNYCDGVESANAAVAGFIYTSCALVGTENLSASLQDFLYQLYSNSRILLTPNPSFCVPFSPQNPPVLRWISSTDEIIDTYAAAKN